MEEKRYFAKYVGERLAEVRASMTTPTLQREVEEAIGVNPNNLSNWEKGYHAPPSFQLKRLCEYYGCSADFVLGLRPVRYTVRQKRLIDKIDNLDDHEQEAVEAIVDTLLMGHQRSDG